MTIQHFVQYVSVIDGQKADVIMYVCMSACMHCLWLMCCSLKSNHGFVLHQIEAMQQKVNVTDPAMCISALEWDSITLEQFKQANLWTTG